MSARIRRRAFTLLEVLVVVTILVLLVALLMPAIGKARESARTASCASNLRQIFQGSMAYASRFDGAFPEVVDWAMHDHLSNGYVTGVDPYTKQTYKGPLPWAAGQLREMSNYIDGRLFKCPSSQDLPPLAKQDELDWRSIPPYKMNPSFESQSYYYTSYWMFIGVLNHPWGYRMGTARQATFNFNAWPTNGDGSHRGCPYDNNVSLVANGFNSVHVAHSKDIKSPKMVLMMDRNYLPPPFGVNYYYDNVNAETHSNHEISARRTEGSITYTIARGANVLLADGSVRWMNEHPAGALSKPWDGSSAAPELRFGFAKYHIDYCDVYYVESDLVPDWDRSVPGT